MHLYVAKNKGITLVLLIQQWARSCLALTKKWNELSLFSSAEEPASALFIPLCVEFRHIDKIPASLLFSKLGSPSSHKIQFQMLFGSF